MKRCRRTAGSGWKAGSFARLVVTSLFLLFACGGMVAVTGGAERAEAAPPRVALTFDDGYNLDHRILEFLSSRGISATAFVIGVWAQYNVPLLQEMDALGWEVCNHTHTHPWLTSLPDEAIRAELNTCQSVIGAATGQFNPFFRPPGGYIDDRVRAVTAAMGYIPVLWDLDSMDTRSVPYSVPDRVNHLVNAARDGSIILFHFGGKSTFELVQGVVEGLSARGFGFVTVGELYGLKDYVRGGDTNAGSTDPSLSHYFAEGTTRPGFDEWLLVMNPGAEEGEVKAGYHSPSGSMERTYRLPPRSRLSLHVNEEVPWQDDVSVVMRSDVPVVAERSLYFNRGKGFNGGSVARGEEEPSLYRCFPESTVRPGFQEYISLFNPGSLGENRVTVIICGESGEVREERFVVPPMSRVTFSLGELVGEGDYSLELRSSHPLCAERAEYFVYNGMITGAHASPGITEVRGEWYFAEGTTRDFYHNYLAVFNPWGRENLVDVVLYPAGGGEVRRPLSVPPRSRCTLNLNELLPAGEDFAFKVRSLLPAAAERSVYFQAHNLWGGSCDRGVEGPSTDWYFAEGCTGEGYTEWLALFNPNPEEEAVEVEYVLEGSEPRRISYLLPPLGRITVNVGEEVGENSGVSLIVRSRKGVAAERSLYYRRR